MVTGILNFLKLHEYKVKITISPIPSLLNNKNFHFFLIYSTFIYKLGKNVGNFKGVFAAAISVLKADLSLHVEETINHAKKNLDDKGVGSAFFGSTGCGQLISISEKKFYKKFSKS